MKIATLKIFAIITLQCFSCIQLLHAQINAEGIPFIKNYSSKTYRASEYNWAVTQDDRGIMYFGNSQSILEYDGTHWTKIPFPGQEFVQSIGTGPDGKIYAGGTDDFGMLKVDPYGQMYYSSLAHLISESIKLTRVWKIYTDDEYVYFCTLQYIFKYSTKTEKITTVVLSGDGNFWSFQIKEKIYTGNYDIGLLSLNDSVMEVVKGGEYYAGKDIFSILPWSDDTLLIATKETGLSFFDRKQAKVSLFNFSKEARYTNTLLLNNQIYSGVKISEDLFAFGTLVDGLFVIDKKGAIEIHINESSGLQIGSIAYLYMAPGNSGMLWLTGTNGMSTVNIQSPVRQFAIESGLNSDIYEITKYNNSYYTATMMGVLKLNQSDKQQAKFEPIEGLEGEMSYALLKFKATDGKEILLAGTVKDVYEINNDKAKPLNFNLEINRLIQSKLKPDLIFAATSGGIKIIYYRNGVFTISDQVLGVPKQYVTKVIEDRIGSLWCNMFLEIALINSQGALLEMPQGITNKKGIFSSFNDDVYFSGEQSVYKYNYSNKDFEPCKAFNDIYTDDNKILKELFPLNDSMVLAHFSQNDQMGNELVVQRNNLWSNDSLSLRQIPSMTLNAAYFDNPLTILGGQEGMFIFDATREKDFFNSYRAIIRKVTIGDDSITYKGGKDFLVETFVNGTSTLKNKEPLEYKYNNISFSYSACFYENEEKLQYKSKLEGFDKQWSAWQSNSDRTYTNLSEGIYQFKVKAINIYGVESQVAVFEFEIFPPWPRTWWAFLIYLMLAAIIIRVSANMYTKKLQEDKRKLERIVKERTAEIVEKNAHIESQNIAITDSIRYAKRIQTAVLPIKQTSELFEYFIYFKPKDIVSGDFYWIYHFEKQQRLIVVAADCTGHGVPGAFMSMLGTSFLNEIVSKLDDIHSDVILNLLRENVIKTLNQGMKEDSKDEQKDGMDMGLVSVNLENMTLEFSGANNPLILIRNNEVIEYKPDKMPIGAYVKQNVPFTRTEIQLQHNDVFYMFSDGFIDQFGGNKGRKYMKKKFKDLLLCIHFHPMEIQNKLINEEMVNWLEGYEQIDDQIVIGMRVLMNPSLTILTNQEKE